jgi:hypothetical protein
VEIEATRYDQSCKQDSDCTVIVQGSSCYTCVWVCAYYGQAASHVSLASLDPGAINVSAVSQYRSDVSQLVQGADPCSCPATTGVSLSARCIDGACQVSGDASAPENAVSDAYPD